MSKDKDSGRSQRKKLIADDKKEKPTKPVRCGRCGGGGIVKNPQSHLSSETPTMRCPSCGGAGKK